MKRQDGKRIRVNKIKEYMIILMKNTKRLTTKNLLVLIVFSLAIFWAVGSSSGYTAIEKLSYESYKDSKIKITFTGDLSPSRYLKATSKKYGNDVYYRDIKSIWQDSHISLVNLKAAGLKNIPGRENYPGTYKPSRTYLDIGVKDIQALRDANINLIGFANNHSMDYGVKGMEESLDIFEEEGIDVVGAGRNIDEAIRPYSTTIGDQTVGIMAMTDVIVNGAMARSNIPGTNQSQYLHRDFHIQNMVEANDFNIIYINWGSEYVLKPDKEIQELGRHFIDLGIDLVVGTHPRVLLPVEKYKDGIIVYSLGNLVSDQKIGRTRDSAILNLYLDGEERCLEFVAIDIRNGIPYKTQARRQISRIRRILTKQLDKDGYKIKDNRLIIDF